LWRWQNGRLFELFAVVFQSLQSALLAHHIAVEQLKCGYAMTADPGEKSVEKRPELAAAGLGIRGGLLFYPLAVLCIHSTAGATLSGHSLHSSLWFETVGLDPFIDGLEQGCHDERFQNVGAPSADGNVKNEWDRILAASVGVPTSVVMTQNPVDDQQATEEKG
jgi:hypothetical protein